MLSECPFCGNNTGYQVKTVERLVAWHEWDQTAIDITLEWISGGKEKYCMDCGRIVTKYFKDGK